MFVQIFKIDGCKFRNSETGRVRTHIVLHFYVRPNFPNLPAKRVPVVKIHIHPVKASTSATQDQKTKAIPIGRSGEEMNFLYQLKFKMHPVRNY